MGEEFVWPDKGKAAVSVCYTHCSGFALRRLDDLRTHGIGATIFVQSTDLLDSAPSWRSHLRQGHEAANGSLLAMTCDGTLPNWTREMIAQDIEMSDQLILEFQPRSEIIALPGTTLLCADGAYLDLIEDRYPYILGSTRGINHPVFSNPQDLMSIPAGPESILETLDALEDGMQRGAWCILDFDLRDEAVRRFHDAFIEVVPLANPNVLWRSIGEVARIVSLFRSQLTVRTP